LYAHGWDIDKRGLPCNQQELAYTLQTFNYVFVQGLRRLGSMPQMSTADEEAYLHAWNVLGHVLGIERGLMAETMAGAKTAFDAAQAAARAQPPFTPASSDPRPALAADLVATLQRYIPLRILKPFPVLLTRHLIGKPAARDLGLDAYVSLLSRAVFIAGVSLVRVVDAVGRVFASGFSIARLIARIFGYQLTVQLLMDQTRPLKLPDALLGQVDAAVANWHTDARAPRWINAVERRFTKRVRPPNEPESTMTKAPVDAKADATAAAAVATTVASTVAGTVDAAADV
jgi:hypothetical protein